MFGSRKCGDCPGAQEWRIGGRRMLDVRKSEILKTITLVLIAVVWPFTYVGAKPPIEWQGPADWWSSDIGTTGGSAVQSGDTFDITGDGHDIWGSSDGFHYMFKELTGNGSITARVVSNGTGTNTWAKGGVMIRNEISPDSAHAMTVVTGGAGSGAAFHWRSSANTETFSTHDPTPSVSPPYWVRVERWGNEFSGYLSADSMNWRQQGTTQIISMNDTVYIGLCVTSHNAESLRTYTFDNISHEGHVSGRPLNLVASQPVPADSTVYTNTWINLSWMPGELAALHNVYFSTDLDAVTQRKKSALVATTDAPLVSIGLPGSAFPDALRMGTTYYWCVDEVNDAEPDSLWQGEVWNFRIPAEPAVYLLITNEQLAPAFEPLVQRRTEQGFPGRLLTVESIYASYLGKDEPEKIRNCIINNYFNNGTQYVALGGDQVIVPVRYCQPYSSGFEMPADLYYADMDGGDWDFNRNGIYGEVGEVNEIELTPNVHLGRIPLRTSEDAAAYINKVITYETASPDGFANSMIFFGDWETLAGDGRKRDFLHHDPVNAAELQQMYIYYYFIQPYWQALPLHFLWDAYSSWDIDVCGDYDFTRDRLIEKINQGYHFLFCWGHGSPGKWGMGGRRFYVEHAASLTNSIPSIIFSYSCSPAHFDTEGTCLTEAFLQNPHGGAIAYFGHTEAAVAGDQDCEQFFPAMARGTDRTTGEIITGILTTLASKRTSDPYRQYNITLHGDPCIQLLAEENGRHLQIFQPKGCEVIEHGTDLFIRWNAAGTGFATGERIKLEYSSDSGHTWHPIPRAQSVPYNGRCLMWRNCPLPAGSHYRVRVVSRSDPRVSDMSGRDFTIGDLGLLTVQSSPVEGIPIDISGDKTASCSLSSNFNITILEGTTVNVSAPVVAGDSSEFAFVRWMDESGNTMTTMADSTFILTQDKTIVAEYDGMPVEWQNIGGWRSGDIGTTGGSAIQSGDTFEITGDGHDIWGSSDGFYYMFKELTGDGSITARIISNGTGTNTWAKGGVMIRNKLSPDSAHAMTVVTGGAGGGAAFHWRSSASDVTSSAHDPTPSISPPYLVRIERRSNEFSGYLSADGKNWRQQGATQTIDMNDTVYIGLCVTSHDAGSMRTYIFDNVSYEGLINDNL